MEDERVTVSVDTSELGASLEDAAEIWEEITSITSRTTQIPKRCLLGKERGELSEGMRPNAAPDAGGVFFGLKVVASDVLEDDEKAYLIGGVLFVTPPKYHEMQSVDNVESALEGMELVNLDEWLNKLD